MNLWKNSLKRGNTGKITIFKESLKTGLIKIPIDIDSQELWDNTPYSDILTVKTTCPIFLKLYGFIEKTIKLRMATLGK